MSLARMALDHEPLNINAWGLWRNALFLGGFYEVSVRVGWEGVRRLPEDPLKRNDLAEILLALNQTDQAFALLTDSLEDGVYNASTFSILTRIYSNRDDMQSAYWAIQEGMEIEPDNAALRDLARKLDQGRKPALVSKAKSKLLNAERADMPDETSLEVERSGTLRSLRHRLRHGDEAALAQLEATLNEDPNFAYAQILAARHKLWKASEQALPPVAAAFEEALAYEDRDRLQALAERMPRIEALVLLARAILGDAEAAETVLDRLANPTSTDDKQVIEILKARIAPVLRLIEGGLSRQEAIAACATQLRTALYDANEASSAPELVAA